ncbi:hypothetical protein [Aromatoleum evansii]|uniref:hypothetical protein n=1 Tax=Aromatoleum evansii TaxID=59406 RepID=UPI001FECC6BE|nr:hypothetical protein [Aromatoleum evansii]
MNVAHDAWNDLDELYEVDESAAYAIDVFLEEAADSQVILERLAEIQHYRSYALEGDWDYDIKRWVALWSRYALLRVRLYDVPGEAANYRIIYAFHPFERRIYILGIVARTFDYDPEHPISKRIIAVYRSLDLS